MNKNLLRIAAAAAFLLCIVLANIVTTRYGFVPVGFGLTATAGTYFAGASFVLRDSLQDAAGRRWTLAVIVVGAAISLLISPLFTDATHLPPGVTASSIALASGVAFLFGETLDLAVYTPLRKHGYVRAAVASNIVGAVVDTYLFLRISGFGLTGWQGQLVGKLAVTGVVILAVGIVRARRAVTA